MKLIKFIAIFLYAVSLSAQTSKKDLYIFFKAQPPIVSKDSTMTFEKYYLNFNLPCDGVKYEIGVNSEGNLKLDKLIVGKPTSNISFTYTNKNSQNNPVVIQKGHIKNSIDFDELKCSVTFQQFVDLFKQFNLYIITEKEVAGDYYLAKKVTFDSMGGM